MNLRILNDPIFPDLFSSCLKLRFDQGHDLSIICQNPVKGWQNQVQGNKADIDTRKARCRFKIIWLGIAEIELLHRDHPRIIAQFPGQLIGPDIHRKDLAGSVLQHDICKATCRSSNINRNFTLYRQTKFVQCFF